MDKALTDKEKLDSLVFLVKHLRNAQKALLKNKLTSDKKIVEVKQETIDLWIETYEAESSGNPLDNF